MPTPLIVYVTPAPPPATPAPVTIQQAASNYAAIATRLNRAMDAAQRKYAAPGYYGNNASYWKATSTALGKFLTAFDDLEWPAGAEMLVEAYRSLLKTELKFAQRAAKPPNDQEKLEIAMSSAWTSQMDSALVARLLRKRLGLPTEECFDADSCHH
jgi:hypothetical protein